MPKNEERIPKDDAAQQVLSIVSRLALLHYCFSQTLVEEFGEEKGKEVIRKAIDLYGEQVGNRVREKALAKGLEPLLENYQEDLPRLGWSTERMVIDGEPRSRVHVCPLARVWKELGVPELGRLYCYIDQAKYKAFNPELECVHLKNVLDGDSYCELTVRKIGRAKKAP